MNDQELLNKILTYIHETGGCDDIGVMLKERHGISVEHERMHRLRRMLVATGYVEEDNYAYGNHPHLSITEAGTRYMMEREAGSPDAQKKELSDKDEKGFFRAHWKWLVEVTVAAIAALAAVASC